MPGPISGGGSGLQPANNLSDVADAATSRTNLGLGTLATQSGTFSGTSSNTNTGDQTNISGNAATVTTNANLTGPVTSTGNATAITDAAVTLAKMANLAQDQFIGRTTGSTGVPETATITAAARTVLDDTTVGAMVDTLGGASATGTGGLARKADPKFTGAIGGLSKEFGFGVDGGGSAVTTQTIKGVAVAKLAGTITGWSISVDAGTATVKFWKIASGTAIPTIANVINTSGVSISSGTHVRSTTVSDFTTTDVAVGDIIMCAITAVATATWISIRLETTTT